MNKVTSELEQKLIARVNRVKGQLGAISRMIEEGEDSKKVSVQISAAVSGIEAVKETFMKIRIMEEAVKSIETALDKFKD